MIVDDEPLARDAVRRLVEQRSDLELCGEAGSGPEALDLIQSAGQQDQPFDLLFLDIQMPGLGGFELLEELAQTESKVNPAVVFITAYDRYAVRAFDTQAVDYLLKPATKSRFNQAVDRCIESRRDLEAHEVRQLLADALVSAPTRLLVKRGSRIVPVPVEQVDWVEANGDYVRLHCGENTHLLERTLSDMERLLEPSSFCRIHRSALVNEARIAELIPLGSGRYEIKLENGTKLIMSRSYGTKFKRDAL